MNKRVRRSLFVVSIVSVIVISYFIIMKSQSNNIEDKIKYIQATIGNKEHTFIIKEHQIYDEIDQTTPFIQEQVLDGVCYNIQNRDSDQLIILTLGKEDKNLNRIFGKAIQIYELSYEKDKVEATLISENNIESVHPFMIEAGKLDRSEAYGNIFVGVYKDARYYHEVVNRPFFFSWNGTFLERKWTGSFLSNYELMDLVFIDMIGDGFDEIAVLEKLEDETYHVALYKWLGFGFDNLATSNKNYKQVKALKLVEGKEKQEIWICYQNGKKEKVDFDKK